MGSFRDFADSVVGLLTALAALITALTAVSTMTVKLIRAGGKRLGDFFRAFTRSRYTAPVLGLIILGLAILITRSPTNSPSCPVTKLSIISPAAGSHVNVSQSVIGRLDCLKSGQHVWLVLQPGGPGGGGYFPQTEVSASGQANMWSTTAYFGLPSAADDGQPFKLLAVIADDYAQRQFRNYLRRGPIEGYLALTNLGSATILTEVDVVRGKFLGS